jgi:hypothetical protein
MCLYVHSCIPAILTGARAAPTARAAVRLGFMHPSAAAYRRTLCRPRLCQLVFMVREHQIPTTCVYVRVHVMRACVLDELACVSVNVIT